MEERSEWKPVINPDISYTLDSRLMEGNTYLERSAPGVYLDSGPTEGASCLEPLEQSVLAYRIIGAISVRSMGGRATGGDRHARASGSGITDIPQTGMFCLVGVADIGSCYSY